MKQAIMNSRKTAFLALCAVHREEGAFLSHFLPPEDHLAREIALGTERRLLTLDHLAQKLAARGELNLKLKEKMLLRMAIYQHIFMDRIPPHALVNETVKLAKEFCNFRFVNFLNAALRKLVGETWALPEGETAEQLALKHSYPVFFIQKLLAEYGASQTLPILEVLNQPSPLTVRQRFAKELTVLQVDSSQVTDYAQDPKFYFQSLTQAHLMWELARTQKSAPKRILDLCSAPGGKLIALSEYFPEAKLFANDLSEKRLQKLSANLQKYAVSAELSCHPAEQYPEGHLFDLILLDVPCSNSGVLHKRPEARWRLTEEKLKAVNATQWACLQKAKRLLAPGGQLWYMTCSILSDENEKMVQRAVRELSFKQTDHLFKHLPSSDGKEGGFATILLNS